jgi:hypothetical protein
LAKLDKGFDVSLVLSLGNFGGAKGIPVMINNNDLVRLQDGKRHVITISHAQMKEGGILPIIPIIAGLIAAAATTAGGVATAVSKSKEAQKNALEADSARKLDELAALKLEKEKSGKGVLEFLKENPNLATSLLTLSLGC